MLDLSTIDMEGLARELARFMSPDALLSASDVGALTGHTGRHVLSVLSKGEGFPEAIRLRGKDGMRSDPRWLRADISKWIASHSVAERRAGRPRKALSS